MAQDWEYNGVNLTRHGFNIQYLGAPLNTAPFRGDNIVVPHKVGRLNTAKWPDQRIVSLSMWVKDIPVDAGTPSTEANMLANLDTLRQLFGAPGQHTLKHSFGSITRLAQAEVVNQVEFRPEGTNNVYRLVVEFLLADPWWYAESATTVGPTSIVSNPQNITVTNAGTYQVDDAMITTVGEIVNPKFTVGSRWVQYTGTVPAGGTLVVNCGAFTAALNGANVTGDISHVGGVEWLLIQPGANTFTVSSSSMGTPAVTVSFTAPFV